MKIAMWSGPRNLSTAMMYSFAARDDCAVMDEPFYAAYLAASGADHPMADEIITTHETDPQQVVADMERVAAMRPNTYMKHMPHHMLPGFPLEWARDCVNVHLIRHPARVIASYIAKRERPNLEDIGFVRQVEIYEEFGGLVIDGTDVRADPGRMMALLCEEIGLDFQPSMLHWPAGPRPEDGVWAKHWYGAVHRSTGFAGAEGDLPKLEPDMQDLCAQAMPFYNRLAAQKLV